MNNIDDFANHCRSMWFTAGSEQSKDLSFKDLFVMSTGLGGETGEVLECLKKCVRDEGVVEFDPVKLAKELGDAMYYWCMVCNYFGFLPSDILALNIHKNEDRAARGVEHGSGDDR